MMWLRFCTTFCFIVLLGIANSAAAQGFLTETFGNTERCAHQNTLIIEDDTLRFELSAKPAATVVVRAILRVPAEGHRTGDAVRLVPIDVADSQPLALRPPRFTSFDVTDVAKTWVADPETNQGLRISEAGGVSFEHAVLEVSFRSAVTEPLAQVTGLTALHQNGQTFLTFKEIEDPVGQDAPEFADFERRVLEARGRREIVYRVYRHHERITMANLGVAEMVAEIPEVISCWNLKAIRNTEHPNQGTPTKRSALRPGYNLALNHVMGRYRIVEGGNPLARGTGLAVLTTTKPRQGYYAVSTAIDGREAIEKLGPGASLERPVDERPSAFPAIVYQRTIAAKAGSQHVDAVDVFNSWLEPPYHNVPTLSETFLVRWKDLPSADDRNRLTLWMTTGHYGDTATSMGNPGWHGARHYVKGALTIGVTEGSLWQGFHECMGTLRGYDDGVVHNYPQRRALSAARWAAEQPDLFVDGDRVSIYGQLAAWALRHGDLFAVVMSDGHANLAVSKEGQKHGPKWGPYPKGSKNWQGIDQWEYMNLPKWIRENPTVELPFWICHPAYGSYPSHTVGDFGFMPWSEMIHAMVTTKRAFAANWSTNGPGPVGPLYELVPRIRIHQSLPAFTNCSLDHSPGDGDHADAEKGGGINLYQRWDPESIVDQSGRWEITAYVSEDCIRDKLVTDLTPRRCQEFKAKPGERFEWVSTRMSDDVELQSGHAIADSWGLVTVEGLELSKEKRRVHIVRSR